MREWNPTQVEVRGTHAVGSQLVAVFDAPEIKPFEVQLTVIEMDSPRLLRRGRGSRNHNVRSPLDDLAD